MRKRHPTINQEREIGRQSAGREEIGRKRQGFVALGTLAEVLMRDVNRKRVK